MQGASNKVIAVALGISQQTVKNHMTSIFRKLGVSDRTEAAIVALRRGWIRLQDTGKLSEESPESSIMKSVTQKKNAPNDTEQGQSFIEYASILLLIAIVVLAILLIMGDEIRAFVNDLLQAWFPG